MYTLTNSEIRLELVTFLSESFPLFDPSLPDSEPLAGHGIDSLGTTEIVLYLEQQFQIQIEDSELTRSNLGTLQAISLLVERKLSRQNSFEH